MTNKNKNKTKINKKKNTKKDVTQNTNDNTVKKKQTIVLSMIVKNESHVIRQTLENLSKHIDYYVINDTGSTDNTKEIIKEYFDSVNIPGEIIDHEFRTCTCHKGKWKQYSFFHFGWNRSLIT